jgi:hypothetical protein
MGADAPSIDTPLLAAQHQPRIGLGEQHCGSTPNLIDRPGNRVLPKGSSALLSSNVLWNSNAGSFRAGISQHKFARNLRIKLSHLVHLRSPFLTFYLISNFDFNPLSFSSTISQADF